MVWLEDMQFDNTPGIPGVGCSWGTAVYQVKSAPGELKSYKPM